MKIELQWPGAPTYWMRLRTLCVSIPFTWNLADVRKRVQNMDFTYDDVLVGGPGVELMPDYFADLPHVRVGRDYPGALQFANHWATKTTTGCVRQCGFCAVPKLEGCLVELDDWPDRPVICDNNLLAASQPHFDKVVDRLKVHGWAEINQGLDARLLTDYHARRLREIGRPLIRLALDNMAYSDQWGRAYELLRSAGFAKSLIRSLAIIAFEDNGEHTVDEAWRRCQWIESHGIKALPMWYHRLDAMENNVVTAGQRALGWTDYERRRIMQWYYQHKEAKR